MIHHYELGDAEFAEQFEGLAIDPSTFSHEAHLRLAWIHIEKYGVDVAVENICRQLKSFVVHLGVPEKYNMTVTVAAIKAVYHFKLRSNSNNFRSFIMENPRLKNNFKDLLEQHYNFDVFNSIIAKNTYIIPDLLPFD